MNTYLTGPDMESDYGYYASDSYLSNAYELNEVPEITDVEPTENNGFNDYIEEY